MPGCCSISATPLMRKVIRARIGYSRRPLKFVICLCGTHTHAVNPSLSSTGYLSLSPKPQGLSRLHGLHRPGISGASRKMPSSKISWRLLNESGSQATSEAASHERRKIQGPQADSSATIIELHLLLRSFHKKYVARCESLCLADLVQRAPCIGQSGSMFKLKHKCEV